MKKLLQRLFGKPAPAVAAKVEKTKEKKPKKPDPFVESAQRYEARLREQWPVLLGAPTSQEPGIAFLITPWLNSAVPMFCMEAALLARLEGAAASLIIDTAEVAQNTEKASHIEAVRHLAEAAAPLLPVIDMDSQPAADGAPERVAAQRMADNIAIWWERGETHVGKFFERNPDAVERIAAHLAKVRRVLGETRPKRLFVPGGIFGLSGIYCRIARELGIPYTTFDSSPKIIIVSRDAVAAHRKDLERVCARIDATSTEAEREKMRSLALAELTKRTKGKDAWGFQAHAQDAPTTEQYDILVPLNLRWDAAALNCERVYDSCAHWLEKLLEWVEKDGRFSICLREHPVGRLPGVGSKEDFGPLLKRFESMGSRLRYAAPEDPLNTYDLMRGAKVVLPYTSTVGLEATILGRPVVVHADGYYLNMGFAWNGATSEEYLARVQEALEGRLQVDERRRDLATMAYYVTQCCSFLPGIFNPNPEPFEKWLALAPRQVLEETNAREIMKALLTDDDVPMYMHAACMAAENKEE